MLHGASHPIETATQVMPAWLFFCIRIVPIISLDSVIAFAIVNR